MDDPSGLRKGNEGRAVAFAVGLVVSLILGGALLHSLLYFRHPASPLIVVFTYLTWLAFCILYPRLPDPRGMVRGVLIGFGLFLLTEFAINTVVLLLSDHRAFVGALYFSMGLFFLLDRLKKMFPSVRERWPLSAPGFIMAALLFLGMFSTVVLRMIGGAGTG